MANQVRTDFIINLGNSIAQINVFQQNINNTVNVINNLNNAVEKNGGLFGQILGGNLASRAITEVSSAALAGGRAILDYSANLEQARIGMTTITGSADEAAKHLKDLQNFAKTTPFEFSELVTASQKLQGVGFAADKVIPILKDVGSALAASGRINDLPFAIKALGDIQAKGKLAGQEVIQLANAGIPAFKVLSGALNKTTAEILQLSESGQISSDVFLKALHQYSQSNFGDALEAQSNTFYGAISNIKDALGQTSEVAFRPLYQKVSNLAIDLTKEVQKNENDLTKVGASIVKSIAKGFGDILRDEISREISDLKEGKSDPFSFVNETYNIGVAASQGSTGGRSLESIVTALGRLRSNKNDSPKKFEVSDLPDLKTLNFFGKYDADIKLLEEEKQKTVDRLIEAITFTGDDFSPIKRGGKSVQLDTKTVDKLSEELTKFNIGEVDSYLNYGKAETNSRLGANSPQAIRENAELEQNAIKEKIRLQKEYFAAQAKALTPQELSGVEGTQLALKAIQTINQLQRQGAIAAFEAQKAINEEIEKGKKKVEELGKQYNSVFDDLFAKSNKDNLFSSVFTENDKAVTELRKNIAGLTPELQAVAEQMQQKINDNSLFNARLENDFAVFDLRERADQLRSYKQPKISDPNKFFSDFLEAGLKQIAATNGGGTRFNLTGAGNSTFGFSQSQERSFTRYKSNIFTGADGKQYTNGFSQSDSRNDLFYNYDRVLNADGSFGGFSRRNRSFADLTNREKDDFINKDTGGLQERLSRQFALANNRTVLNADQQSLIDKKIIALSSGLRPEELDANKRDQIAAANEREATKKSTDEAAIKQEREADRKIRTQLNTVLERLADVAEKEGTKGIEGLIRIVNETNGEISVEQRRLEAQKKIQDKFNNSYKGGTFYEEFDKK